MRARIQARALEIFEHVIRLDGIERQAALEHACGSDIELREEVQRLISSDAQDWPLLDHGVEQLEEIRPFRDASFPALTSLGDYQILGELGSGAMGAVYRAVQRTPNRQVALKLVRTGTAPEAQMRRFENEVELLGRMSHPGIAQIYDAGVADAPYGPQPFIAMELVEGVALNKLAVQNNEAVEPPIRLLIQICEAVEYAHRRGVIHRDLKPSNILVETIGNGYRPRILDFGIARLLDSSRQATLLTEQGQLLGTLPYMSPEQVRGDSADLDTRSDVYALGVLGFELITGTTPIDVKGRSITEAIRRIQDEEARTLGQVNPNLRGDLDVIFTTVLDKDRSRRYQSAASFAEDLSRYLEQRPIAARPATTWYILRRFAARKRAMFVGLALAVILASAGVIGTAIGLVQARIANERLADTAVDLVEEIVKLQEVAGTREYRIAALTRLDSEVADLLIDLPHDVRLQSAYADILMAIGGFALEENRHGDALDLRGRALAARRQVVAESGSPQYRRKLLTDMVLVGDVHRAAGNLLKAEEFYRDVFDTQTDGIPLLDSHRPSSLVRLPGDDATANDVLWSFSRIGNLYLEQGELPRAKTWLEDGMRLAHPLLEQAPENKSHIHMMMGFQAVLFDVASAQFMYDEALDYALERLGLARRLLALEPHNRWYQHHLSGSLVSAAAAFQKVGDDAAATEHWREALPFVEEKLRQEPDDPANRFDLLSTLVALSGASRTSGDFEEAIGYAEGAIAAIENHVSLPHPKFWRYSQARLFAAKAAGATGDQESAREHLVSAHRAIEQYLALYPDHTRALTLRAELLFQTIVPELRDLDAARSVAGRALELQPLPDTSTLLLIGQICEASGDVEAARDYYREAGERSTKSATRLRDWVEQALRRLERP